MAHPGHQAFHPIDILEEEAVIFHHGGDAFGFGALGYGATGGGQAVGHLLEAGGGPGGAGDAAGHVVADAGRSQQKRQLQFL